MSKAYIPASLRELVYDRAKGCCEYCLIPEVAAFSSHQIDHIIAQKHGGLTKPENLALSCSLCNKFKGSDLTSIDPQTGKITPLYHPRADCWSEHFKLTAESCQPLTAKGRATVQLLKLNRSDRVSERKILLEAGILQVSNFLS